MIRVNRLDGTELVLNADLVECVEARPDTVITLTSGKKLIVRNSVDEIYAKFIEYKRLINECLGTVKTEG
ncbi:MAG TPA: flagellar FlbD family protein [Firmicutes bacterium]|nr:flagellar FlbD family protein [Bacillota bacterium]HHY98113.1 flagellar FlbD family protein [Bacillota bacterium]